MLMKLPWISRQRLRLNQAMRALTMAPLADDLHDIWVERDERPLSPHERDMLQNVLRFSEVVAGEIGVPRASIVGVPVTASRAEVIAAFNAYRHSRILVYGRDLDEILGILSVKALLRHTGDFNLQDIVHMPVLVPETMPLPKVLQTMKRQRYNLVVVTDEYGGTSGLLTLKDILEVLVGDIEDEHDLAEGVPVVAIGEGRFRVLPTAPLSAVENALDMEFPFEGTPPETLGGLVLAKAKKVPLKGDKFLLAPNVEVLVTGCDGRRILGLECRLLSVA